MAFSGSCDSAAATVAISAPTIEKTTTTTEEKIAPSRRKTTMAATLMPANQYSNSPYEPTENRLVPVISVISARATSHSGTSGSQNCTTLAPATASKPTTTTQKYQ